MHEYDTSIYIATKTYKEVICNSVKRQSAGAHTRNSSYKRRQKPQFFLSLTTSKGARVSTEPRIEKKKEKKKKERPAKEAPLKGGKHEARIDFSGLPSLITSRNEHKPLGA
jgi:hypothetical protein